MLSKSTRDTVSRSLEEDLNDLDDGEFYYHEIIGLKLYEGENLIGTIKEILQPGANDVWWSSWKGKRDLLLPYIPPVVLNVDIPNKRVDVEILEGLDDEDWYFNPLPEMFSSTGALNCWKGSRKKGPWISSES